MSHSPGQQASENASGDNQQSRHERAMALFQQVCDLDLEDQTRVLRQACADDPSLQLQVQEMLRFDADDHSMIAPTMMDVASCDLQSTDTGFPETIGRYRLIRRMGAGGMGTVFEAEQESPKRRVALKILHANLGDTARMQARFIREGQIQSGLMHVGIAQVYEAGISTVEKRAVHYLAMELVEGQTLTDFVRARALPLPDILQLVLRVCDAVSFAHQRGVIHRDLKPANILVIDASGDPVPKVLDFGIAKLTKQDVNLASMHTSAGQIIGTLAYMSPEQVTGKLEDIDTRVDIYALGLILYELLAGRLPIDVAGAPLPEAIRRISEQAPTRLASVDSTFRGDLDTIVHKALAKDRAQRYDSASEFAADIRRYLRHEPIIARPPSTIYQLRKFARRNRVLAVSIATVACTLVVAVIATTLLAISASRARSVAERKTLVAEGVSNVLLNALTTATPKGSMGKEPLLINAIDRIEAQVSSIDSESSVTTPEVRAVVFNILGIIHRERGELDHAELVFTKALDIRRSVLASGDPNLADSINNMGLLRRRQGRPAEAAEFYEQAVALQRASTFRDDARLARNIYNLASAYIAAGDVPRAKPLLEEALAMHRRVPSTGDEILNYYISARARIALHEKQFALANDLAVDALAKQRAAVGPTHPTIALCLVDLAQAQLGLARPSEAIATLQEAQTIALAVFPTPSHQTTKTIRLELIRALRVADQSEAAQELERIMSAE
jgi:serine/threonine protein kinase